VAEYFAEAVPLDVLKQPALAVLVNFGRVTGREPTRRELEQLAQVVRDLVPVFSIVDEQRFEVGEEIEVLLTEVRIEVSDTGLALTEADPPTLRSAIVAAARDWVSRCADDAGEPSTLAERLAGEAVVGENDPAARRQPGRGR
jgi:hypothetical protein